MRMKRIFAMYLALNLVFEVISPSLALALTNGPGQPEMQSFEPVGTSEMVDVFTGDFNYNIPLINVPGPNGGYPINMAYHSGIGMEDEASWVGLGWNINAGAITREMRGLPDDFDGDVVTKEMSMRPNRTIGTGMGIPLTQIEIWGAKIEMNMNLRMSWNNYQGIGVNGGLKLSASPNQSGASEINHNNGFSPSASLSLDFNSQTGESELRPNFSLAYNTHKSSTEFTLGASINNLQGLKDFNFSAQRTKKTYFDVSCFSMTKTTEARNFTMASTTSFASSSYVPHSEFSQNGFMFNTWFNLGVDVGGVYPNLNFNADYTETRISDKHMVLKAYGYMHSEDRHIEKDEDPEAQALMDFNREKDAALCKDIPSMPIPVFTHDIYMVKGQGVGGLFRPFRSDLGILHDPIIKGENYGVTMGAEFGAGIPMHFGGNTALTFSRSYNGPWRKYETWESLAENQFSSGGKSKTDNLVKDPLYEPFYFMTPSGMTANLNDENDRVSAAGKYPISMIFSPPDVSSLSDLSLDNLLHPFVEARVDDGGMVARNKYDNRRARSEYMGYKSIAQIKAYPNYQSAWIGNTIYKRGEFPRNGSAQGYSFPSNIDHQIGEISVTNPDGNRYVYALPAYNFVNKDATFAIEKGVHPTFYNEKIINYNSGDASTDNTQQKSRFFASNTIPTYAHSYMLTAIVSPDYIDLTGNGPSDDDFGYYVKFNYSRTHNNYHWRAPYEGANFLRGHLSTDMDDKAGYVYGEKENWYLNSIETKTHIAEFKLSPREDGYGAGNEHQNVNQATYSASQQLYKLDEISLYAKNDPNYAPAGPSNPGSTGAPTPLKTVHFEYNYALCPNVRNNSGIAVSQNGSNANQNKGKLTLKKVWFTYLNNTKGSLSPYVFDYHEGNALENPAYDILQIDRWGNYRKDNPAIGDDNTVNPYTSQRLDVDGNGSVNQQDADIRNAMASAWNLKRIVLPSGGELKVDYESDDYGYVQDKQAMQMTRIIGYADNINTGVVPDNELGDNKQFLIFELEDESTSVTDSDVKRYGGNISDLFFKAYIDLKDADGMKTDYVQGYAETETGECGLVTANVGGASKKCGYIKLKKIAVKDNGDGGLTHPFRKAGWQYMKLERPEVLYPGSQIGDGSGEAMLKQSAQILFDMFNSLRQLFSGYYKFCYKKSYARYMNTNKPSFVRLNSPDRIKYGGGHRVKRITISDLWAQTGNGGEQLSEYGLEYSYRLPDGSSSGVAAYEPLIGGEEIPHRKPIRYSSPYFIFKNKNLYLEEPLGESYFPAPIVGYSRVTIKNVAPPQGYSNTKTQDGFSVYEFYTAKEFPVMISTTAPDHEKFTPKIPIPCIGSVMFDNHGYSQRMTVETNDMHGKLHTLSTYVAGSDPSDPNNLPVTRTEYLYQTDAPYSSAQANHLNNRVQALFGHLNVRDADMGVTREFFTDMRESSGVTMKQGFQSNMEVVPSIPPEITFTGFPIVDYSENLFKSVMAMDVIGRNGILSEIKSYNEGSRITTKNLLYDAYSGQALQTSVTNDFDKPIYTYNYAAHWTYDGMDNAFKNAGTVFDFDINGGTRYLNCNYSTRNAYDLFYPGDEILVMNGLPGNALPSGQPTTYWVKQVVSNSEVELIDEQGNRPSTAFTGKKEQLQGIITRSGHRNQQSLSNGAIVSLGNLREPELPIITAWNQKSDSIKRGLIQPVFPMQLYFMNCGGNMISAKVFSLQAVPSPSASISFSITPAANAPVVNSNTDVLEGNWDCKFQVYFPGNIPSNWYLYKLKFNKAQNKIEVTGPGQSLMCDYNPGCNLRECVEVLKATASVFSDDWSFDYVDVGNPLIKLGNTTVAMSTLSASANPYRIGKKGIWRAQKNYLYQENRRQSMPDATKEFNTNIAKDGAYNDFEYFDWSSGNARWTLANTVTRYSPYGFELENKNALNIYSTALYGYNNALPTAVAANTSYYELAFDGFEEQKNGYAPKGHLALTPSSGNIKVSAAEAHTGKQSLEMSTGQTLNISTTAATSNFRPVVTGTVETRYTVSAWFKTSPGIQPQITVSGQIHPGYTQLVSDGLRIEGWQKMELNFAATGNNVNISFALPPGNLGYIDDVRIQPFKSQMKSYVYNPQNLWLIAELDAQNYATYYNYDQEGILVQTKKETTNGIQTLRTSRSHVRQ